MNKFFGKIGEIIRRQRLFFIVMIVFSAVLVVLGVITAFKLDGSILPLDLANIVFIRYLSGKSGFGSLLFNTLLSIVIFCAIIVLCGYKKFLLPISIIFYLYFVYAQIVIFTSVILIYGFFNTLILLIVLLAFMFAEIALLLVLLCFICQTCGCSPYFQTLTSHSMFLWLLLALLIINVVFVFLLWFLKSYIILLVF